MIELSAPVAIGDLEDLCLVPFAGCSSACRADQPYLIVVTQATATQNTIHGDCLSSLVDVPIEQIRYIVVCLHDIVLHHTPTIVN
jgi:hypothetical protein